VKALRLSPRRQPWGKLVLLLVILAALLALRIGLGARRQRQMAPATA